jgi:hypothetical protein
VVIDGKSTPAVTQLGGTVITAAIVPVVPVVAPPVVVNTTISPDIAIALSTASSSESVTLRTSSKLAVVVNANQDSSTLSLAKNRSADLTDTRNYPKTDEITSLVTMLITYVSQEMAGFWQVFASLGNMTITFIRIFPSATRTLEGNGPRGAVDLEMPALAQAWEPFDAEMMTTASTGGWPDRDPWEIVWDAAAIAALATPLLFWEQERPLPRPSLRSAPEIERET